MLAKVSPIKLKNGNQAKAEAFVEAFASQGLGQEDGTLSFRVYRDPRKTGYLLVVEHFTDQAVYDAHPSLAAYRELITGRFAEFDDELLVSI